MELLKLNQVSYQYEKTAKIILDGINFSFEAGKLYCINGASGAGKSTLLSLIAGLDVPTSGKIFFDGTDIAKMDRDDYRAKKMSVIFQNYNLLQNATVAENIMLAANISGKKMDISKIYGLLSKVGLDNEMAGRKAAKLSGGEQQRVAVARALAGGSCILVADEPTGNLDSENEDAIMEIFKQLAHEMGKCVIVVTHSKKASRYADEILLLDKGTLKISDAMSRH